MTVSPGRMNRSFLYAPHSGMRGHYSDLYALGSNRTYVPLAVPVPSAGAPQAELIITRQQAVDITRVFILHQTQSIPYLCSVALIVSGRDMELYSLGSAVTVKPRWQLTALPTKRRLQAPKVSGAGPNHTQIIYSVRRREARICMSKSQESTTRRDPSVWGLGRTTACLLREVLAFACCEPRLIDRYQCTCYERTSCTRGRVINKGDVWEREREKVVCCGGANSVSCRGTCIMW